MANNPAGLPIPPTPDMGPDPRSMTGIFARGRNNYNGSTSPPGAGRPRNPVINLGSAIDRLLSQGDPQGNPINSAAVNPLGRRLPDGTGPYQLQ